MLPFERKRAPRPRKGGQVNRIIRVILGHQRDQRHFGDHSRSSSLLGDALPPLHAAASVPLHASQHDLTAGASEPLSVMRKEEAMEIDVPQMGKTGQGTDTIERLEKLRREIADTHKIKRFFSELLADPSLEISPVKPSFLTASVSVKLGGKFGEALHGERWRPDPRWMREEIGRFLAADRTRLEEEHKARIEKLACGGSAEGDAAAKSKREVLHVVPQLHRSRKAEEQTMAEVKALCRCCKEKRTERLKAELAAAKHARLLAETKLQSLYSELKTKLVSAYFADRAEGVRYST